MRVRASHSQSGARLRPTGAGPGVQARVVLNTSTSEGMCNSLLEAMLVGTPVLARANPGNAALLGHGDAIGLALGLGLGLALGLGC